MYETNGQLNAWWQRRLGSYVLEAEIGIMPESVRMTSNRQVLVLGCSEQVRLLGVNELATQYVLNRTVSAFSAHRGIRGAWDNLPIADNSIDILIIPHTLEMLTKTSRSLFNEVFRVLKPEGDLVVFGFNPSIIWRVWQHFFPSDCAIPWICRCRKRGDLRFSLSLLDYRFVDQKTIIYQLPEDGRRLMRWINMLFWVIKKLCPWFGGVYMLHARKQALGVKPIKLSWKEKYKPVSVTESIVPTRRAEVECE